MAYKKTDFFCDGIKAIFIGRLDMYHKGIDLLLEAVSQIKEELSLSHFKLAIYGPIRYDYYQIEQEIIKYKLSDLVSIHNEVSGEEKIKVLLDSDLFVMTSRFEGHPMGLIEALAYGLPCLVTPGTNMAEEIKEYDAGWTCQGNVLSIAESIKQKVKMLKFYPEITIGTNLQKCFIITLHLFYKKSIVETLRDENNHYCKFYLAFGWRERRTV